MTILALNLGELKCPNILVDIKCCIFSWSGQYTAANVMWTVPTRANVKVCLSVDGNYEMMTVTKAGFLLKQERLGYTAVDGGDLLKLC